MGALGRQGIRLPHYLLELTLFIVRALRDWRRVNRQFNLASYRSLVAQIIFTGIDALPTITLLSLVSGLAISSQTILTIQLIGDRADVIEILIKLVVFELSTLLTAVVIIGRSGSAIAVDLGNMKLHKELDGLEMLGIHLNHFLITPRLLGTAISQMILVVYFSTLAIVSGVLFLSLSIHPGYLQYLPDTAQAFHPYDLLVLMGKNLLFGLMIGAIACYHALHVEHSQTEVPQQTQRAIVNSLTLIFVLNALFSITVY